MTLVAMSSVVCDQVNMLEQVYAATERCYCIERLKGEKYVLHVLSKTTNQNDVGQAV